MEVPITDMHMQIPSSYSSNR